MDPTIKKRLLLFLLGCIPVRLLITYIAFAYPAWLPYMGALALIPAVAFTVIYICGWRKTGAEVFGGRIWWNSLRPVHAALYFAFAIAALRDSHHAWKFLFADVVMGLTAFLVFHRKSIGM
jgi:hypothetical protein